MDPITHGLTGYVIGNAIYKEDCMGKKAYLSAFNFSVVMGAVLPDIDFISRFVGGNTLYFMVHRTITHSIPGIFIESVLCALTVKLIKKTSAYTALFFGALIGSASHVLFDITNVYSTFALWPFSQRMCSLGIMPIVDLLVLCLYTAAMLLSYLKPLKMHRRKIFASTLLILIFYIGLKSCIQFNLKDNILSEYEKGSLTGIRNPPKVDNIAVMTDFIYINSWNFIIENKDEFIKGTIYFPSHRYSNIASVKKKVRDTAVQRALETPLGKFVLRFSPYVDYTVTNYKDGYLVRLTDLRYTFPLKIGKMGDTNYLHILGGYVILDKQYNLVFWTTENPLRSQLHR